MVCVEEHELGRREGGGQPAVSVVVPTRDRPDHLRRCLDAVVGQEVDFDLEVIVVDDGSAERDRIRDIAESRRARIVHLQGTGPARARNAGVEAATGDVVVFLDDDCLPGPHWASLLVTAVVRGHGDVVHGSVVPARPDDPLLVANEVIVDHLTREARFVPTSNLAARRALLREHPFDERFALAAGEDREWCLRLDRAGRVIGAEPGAVVRHNADVRFVAFLRRHVRYGRAARQLVELGVVPSPRDVGPRFYAKLVRRGFSHGFGSGLAVLLAQGATAAGYLVQRAHSRLGSGQHRRSATRVR